MGLRPSAENTLLPSACTPSTRGGRTQGPTRTGRSCTRVAGRLSAPSPWTPSGRRFRGVVQEALQEAPQVVRREARQEGRRCSHTRGGGGWWLGGCRRGGLRGGRGGGGGVR